MTVRLYLEMFDFDSRKMKTGRCAGDDIGLQREEGKPTIIYMLA